MEIILNVQTSFLFFQVEKKRKKNWKFCLYKQKAFYKCHVRWNKNGVSFQNKNLKTNTNKNSGHVHTHRFTKKMRKSVGYRQMCWLIKRQALCAMLLFRWKCLNLKQFPMSMWYKLQSSFTSAERSNRLFLFHAWCVRVSVCLGILKQQRRLEKKTTTTTI